MVKYLDNDPSCFPQYTLFFIGLPALIFSHAELNSEICYCDFCLSFSASSFFLYKKSEIVSVNSSLIPL